jgi:alpha-ribazole phosphatase
MTELILIRHGRTDWNQEKRYQGQQDIPLNTAGIRQASQLAERLCRSHLEAVYTSDLKRALQTASILAEALGLNPVPDPRLREINHGQWEGLLYDDIRTRFPEEYARFHTDPVNAAAPGGEQISCVQQRVENALADIVSRHPDGSVAVVSHGLALATFLSQKNDGSLDRVFEWIPGNAEPVAITLTS